MIAVTAFRRCFFSIALDLLVVASHADLLLIPDPVSATASTSFNATYAPEHLYDATPSAADVGTNFDSGNVSQYAGIGPGPHVIVYDYGESVTFEGIAYSQRLGGDPVLDKVQNIDVWATDTDPGPASLTIPEALGAPQGNTGQLDTAAGLTSFLNYPLGVILTGRYVVFQFNDAGGTVGNPGGSEMQLTIETGPADPGISIPPSLDFGRVGVDSPPMQSAFQVTNVGATQRLAISGVTIDGGNSGNFSVISFPDSLAPGASGDVVIELTPGGELGSLRSDAVIESNDVNRPIAKVPLTATIRSSVPDNLEFVADPVAISASSFFNATYAPEFLYDAELTIDDFENPAFDPLGQYAGSGTGPHVLVFDFGATVNFDGIAYAQRLGGIVDADKVPSIELWVSDADPGLASLDLPILSGPPAAMAELVTTDTSPLLRYYDIGTLLSGRYVVMRLGVGTYNPGGSELQLTLVGSAEPVRIIGIEFDGASTASLTWTSREGQDYTIERSTDMRGEWDELDDGWTGQPETTTYVDDQVPEGTRRMFYRVSPNQ